MFSANPQAVVKANGYIQKYNGGNFEIGINYGSTNDSSSSDWSENILATDVGTILQKQKKSSPTKLTQNVPFLTEPAVKILIDYHNLIVKKRQAKLIFTISAENKISTIEVKYAPLTISSYYHTTKNPQKAQKPEVSIIQQLGAPSPHSNIFKNPKIHYIESSHHISEHAHQKAISLLNGNQLVQNIVTKRLEKQYKQALVGYITETLKVNKDSGLIYQSVCISKKNQIDLGLQGASYIINSPEFFIEELHALKQLQQQGNKDIKLSIPWVKNVGQVKKIKEIMRSQGVTRTHKLQLLLNIQIPSALFTLDTLLSEGVDGAIFDIESISQLLLGMNNDIIKKEKKYYDPAILHALSNALDQTKRAHLPLYINMPEPDQKALELIPHASHTRIIFPA